MTDNITIATIKVPLDIITMYHKVLIGYNHRPSNV